MSKREDLLFTSDNGNPIPKHLRPSTLTKNELHEAREKVANKLVDPKLRKLRRQQIVMSKVMGVKTAQIGELFNITPATVQHELRIASKGGELDDLNQRILDELVPDALSVYTKKMREENDAFVAKDVLKHLDRLTARKDEKAKQQEVQYSMEAYIKSKKQLPNGEFVDVEERIKGEAARQYLEQGNLEPASARDMGFMKDIVVEKKDE